MEVLRLREPLDGIEHPMVQDSEQAIDGTIIITPCSTGWMCHLKSFGIHDHHNLIGTMFPILGLPVGMNDIELIKGSHRLQYPGQPSTFWHVEHGTSYPQYHHGNTLSRRLDDSSRSYYV